MKRKKSLYLGDSGDTIHPPAYPHLGYRLLSGLRDALGSGGRKPTLEALAAKLGVGLSTCHNWFCVGRLEPIQALLCLMERVPEEQWLPTVRGFLRDFPNLKHPRLAHDPGGLVQLEQLLKQPTGLTMIRGDSDATRTFMITALGHSFALTNPQGKVVGLDVHEPVEFVPLEGVLYFKNTTPSARRHELLLQEWARIRASHEALIVCNRVLSVAPELAMEIAKVAATSHVLLADRDQTGQPSVGPDKIPSHRAIEIVAASGNSTGITWQLRT